MGGRGSKGNSSAGNSRRKPTDVELANEIARDVRPPTEPPAGPRTPEADPREAARYARAEKIIHKALDDIMASDRARLGEFIKMTDLRAELDMRGISRATQDKYLKQLSKDRKLYLNPESNRKILEQADHDAAVQIGGQANHLAIWRRST
jgi:hypothetical protein